jgi:glutamyl-tRNA synthetase
MKTELVEKITAKLTEGLTVPARAEVEAAKPLRHLPEGAEVTRVAPSPTGFVHIGTIYTALLCDELARQTGGVFYLRIEDTDKKREIENGDQVIRAALDNFGLTPAEVYKQSERVEIYLAYAVDLLKSGRAYPCFATLEELEQNFKAQQAAKVRPGYYGQWALWRDKSDAEIEAALDAGKPFVLRFRSSGSHDKRVAFSDELKGQLELPENDLDIPLIKADGSRLPTYHLAHVVDDFLMGTTLVIRGDEWLPSLPLHIELAQALGITPFRYAHIAPITILDKATNNKRKLSKRKDPQANVAFFYELGYPIDALKLYLFGLANSDLDVWFKEHAEEPISNYGQLVTMDKLAKSRAPLFDESKLDFYSRDMIGVLPQETFNQKIQQWLSEYGVEYCRNNNLDPEVPTLLLNHFEELKPALAIERSGEKVRKDVAKWSDVIEEYGYFIDSVYDKIFAGRIDELLQDFDTQTVSSACANFLSSYSKADDQPTWFEKLKIAAETSGFALDNKAYKANPENFKGNLADFARIIRVKLTGKNRTPDMHSVMRVMPQDTIGRRIA